MKRTCFAILALFLIIFSGCSFNKKEPSISEIIDKLRSIGYTVERSNTSLPYAIKGAIAGSGISINNTYIEVYKFDTQEKANNYADSASDAFSSGRYAVENKSPLNLVRKQYWAMLENQLLRRYDLITNLVGIIKTNTKGENEICDKLTSSYSAWSHAKSEEDKYAISIQIEEALKRMTTLLEKYPQLRASDNFKMLKEELTRTDNRVVVARMRYEQTIKDDNANAIMKDIKSIIEK